MAKCKEEVQKTKEKYDQALKAIDSCNAKYMEDMKAVFEKCQEFEGKRLDFFKKILFDIHGCLNISADQELPLIYEEYRHTIQNADSSKDLKWWSKNNGVEMATNWPVFEVPYILTILIIIYTHIFSIFFLKRIFFNFLSCPYIL